MAYTRPTATSQLAARKPVPNRVRHGAPATADSSVPATPDSADTKLIFDGYARLRLGLLLDGGTAPTASVSVLQWVPDATSWITLDSQSGKSSGYSWEVNCPPGTYFLHISAVTGSPTDVCVTAQAAERF